MMRRHSARPIPWPSCSSPVVPRMNMAKMRWRWLSGTPGPSSATVNCQLPWSRSALMSICGVGEQVLEDTLQLQVVGRDGGQRADLQVGAVGGEDGVAVEGGGRGCCC